MLHALTWVDVLGASEWRARTPWRGVQALLLVSQ